MPLRRRATRSVANIATDIVEQQRKDAIAKINKLLKEKSEQIFGCLNALEQDMFLSKGDPAQQEEWPGTYTTFVQIPKYWMSALLCELVTNLDKDKMALIDQKNKDSIRQMSEFAFGIRMQQKLPRPLLKKTVLSHFLKARFVALGSRISAAWVASAVNVEGTINWSGHGVYKLQSAQENSQHISSIAHSHRANCQAAIPAEIVLIRPVGIEKNWSDVSAHIKKGLINLSLLDHFPEFQAFQNDFTNDALRTAANASGTEIARRTTEAQQDAVAADPAALPRPRRRAGPPQQGGRRVAARQQ